MSDAEMDEWSNEGELAAPAHSTYLIAPRTIKVDRVQWFRAEAEMQRW
jgi:hypothetical protein